MLYQILLFILAILIIVYKFLTWNFNHWKRRHINGPKPTIVVGNLPSQFNHKRHPVHDLQDIYESYKRTDSFVGIFNCRIPQLLITSPDLVRRVFVHDFKHFHDNETSTIIDKKSNDILAMNPFVLTGEEWKERRAEVTPGLTNSRIKSVFPITLKVCDSMIEFIKKQLILNAKSGIDGKDLCIRFTSEVVTDCVLGISSKSFSEQPLPTMKMIQNIFETSFLFLFQTIILGLIPSLVRFMKIRLMSKKAEDYFMNLMQQAVELRKSQKKEGLDRTDFLNYMLQLQEKKQLSNVQFTSHTMTFLFDGFETSATVMTHCLLFLGRDRHRQEKLRTEIRDKLGKSTDFDSIMELPYLNACIHEALRIFPLGFSNKICTESIEYSDKSGRLIKILEGDIIVLPIHAIMVDEDYYANAQSFEPERFLAESTGFKEFKEKGLYYGFGDGPRTCIGMRFALAQIKAGLIEIMRHFVVKVHPKTRSDNQFDAKYFLLRLDGGVWLEFENLT